MAGIPPAHEIVKAHDTTAPTPLAASSLPGIFPLDKPSMPGPTTTLLIEGSFEELTDELAQYIDNLKKTHGDENSSIQAECEALLKDNQKDEVLKKLVMGSQTLNQAPEKGMQSLESSATPMANSAQSL